MTGVAGSGLVCVLLRYAAWFGMAMLWVAATGEGAGAAEPPSISVKVAWDYRELGKSERHADGPQGVWKTVLSLSNSDSRAWTVVPHMVFGEESEKVLNCGGALCVPDAQGEVPLGAQAVPGDTSGQRRVELTVRLSPDHFGSEPIDLAAEWRADGKVSRWAATALRSGGRLDCQWEELSPGGAMALDPQARVREGYHLTHLGPIVFDPSAPEGIAYILSARSAVPAGDGKRLEASAIEFIPLTGDVVRGQIDDAARKPAWRREAVLLLWRHPRPCRDADAIMADIVAKSKSYPEVYETALRSLAARRAKAPLVGFVRDKKTDSYVRTLCLANLGPMLTKADAAWLSAVEKDAEESDYMRRHAEHMRTHFCKD